MSPRNARDTLRTWRCAGWRLAGEVALFEAVRPALEGLAEAARKDAGVRQLGPFPSYFKGSGLRPRPALRHFIRRRFGLEIPRLQEFSNLEWLRAHGFRAPRPLLAGVRGPWPRFQFLYTEFVPEVRTVAEAFPEAEPGTRRAWLGQLARDLARLHGLGFVHRDLFARNLLVGSADDPRCTFLDAWRGGPRRGSRGPDHDLACLFLDGASLFRADEQELFLTTYREESRRVGRRLPRSWPERLETARNALLERERRRHPELAPRWTPPSLPPEVPVRPR